MFTNNVVDVELFLQNGRFLNAVKLEVSRSHKNSVLRRFSLVPPIKLTLFEPHNCTSL